ncbi:MAG: YbjN domain-containing protein, partial [Pseudomonadota bacterium]
METLEQYLTGEDADPIDIVETLATHNSWDFDRVADNQIAMAIEGSWQTYSLSLAWS